MLPGSALARATPRRPDLVETAVVVTQHGAALRVTDAVRNSGDASAPRFTTGYFLSRVHVRLGGHSISKLLPHATSRGSATLPIPDSVLPGSYRVVACADDGNRIRESNERNNCRATSRVFEVTDRTPPKFAGLTAATTCIPGPVGGGTRSSSYYLRWSAAADNVTSSAGIVYDVYQVSTSGSEDFSAPTYTTPAGATSFTPPLPDDRPYYFFVRARDAAGNSDPNRVERRGVNLCL